MCTVWLGCSTNYMIAEGDIVLELFTVQAIYCPGYLLSRLFTLTYYLTIVLSLLNRPVESEAVLQTILAIADKKIRQKAN